MRADNTAPIIADAKRRHELTRAKAIQAIRALDRAGTPVTFAATAGQAGVSRSWLYSQPDIRDQIQQLRTPQADPRPRRSRQASGPLAPPASRPLTPKARNS